MFLIAVLGVFGAARVGGTSVRRFSPHFFVLGTAFLLLETRSLVSFSLLFGSTWLVNALAFFAILASVLLAILVNARWRIRRAGMLYGLLFVALAMAFALPPESLLIDPPWLRYLLAGVVAFAPVFLANLVFTYSFRDTRTADMAFASNLLGAMAGGALEYVALLTGYRSSCSCRRRALPPRLALCRRAGAASLTWPSRPARRVRMRAPATPATGRRPVSKRPPPRSA